MNKEMDLVIVEMDAINVFGFVNKNETKEEAKSRANKYYCDELELVKGHLKHYGGDYWKSHNPVHLLDILSFNRFNNNLF